MPCVARAFALWPQHAVRTSPRVRPSIAESIAWRRTPEVSACARGGATNAVVRRLTLCCVATRKCWSERRGVGDDSMKFGRLSSGFKSRLAKAEPGRPVASLAAVAVRWRLMRRYANFWAEGNAAPKSVCTRLAQGLQCLEGSSVAAAMGEEASRLAECTTLARNTEDSPVTWEIPVFPRDRNGVRRAGPESPRLHALADARVEPPRISICSLGRPKRGEPERRPKEKGKSEDRIRAVTLGKSLAPRPRRAKTCPC